MNLGIFDHFGWAIAVTASGTSVVDRRRLELVEPGITPAPIHYDSKALDVDATTALVAKVKASVMRASTAALDELAASLPQPITSISLRSIPSDFPRDIAVLRAAPYEARADAVMYRKALAELAEAQGWAVHFYDAREIVRQAGVLLGDAGDTILNAPRLHFGPPWTQEHRIAFAAAILAGD